MELSELVEVGEFFAPSCNDAIDGLIAQYNSSKAKIEAISDMFSGDLSSALHYFLEGNNKDRYCLSVEKLFKVEGAMAALNSAYWSKALAMTDILSMMPQKRRDEWHKSISEQTTPAFEDATVRATISSLMEMRMKFLSERVDGLFRSLSGEHVTNSPAAFGKRMIIAGVLNEYASEQYRTAGHINDLRAIIAKFSGRGEPDYRASSTLIKALQKKWGEWVSIDCGSLRIRLYKKGTAHMEINPDIAYRLNQILAHLYPSAIPAEFRRRPVKSAKKLKEFEMMDRPLPFAVLNLLDASSPRRGGKYVSLSIYGEHSKVAIAEAGRVLESIGGVKSGNGYTFDYDPLDAMTEIIVSGSIPDKVSHQYYPTPENVALEAIEIAEIEDHHECLEPSAGQGGLADYLPKERTTCIEISKLHCDILTSKGFRALQGDFISLKSNIGKFDRVVMNPPYSEGRWRAHTTHAVDVLKSGGVILAILPASAKNSFLHDNLDITWSREYDNEFSGTGISVVIMRGVKK